MAQAAPQAAPKRRLTHYARLFLAVDSEGALATYVEGKDTHLLCCETPEERAVALQLGEVWKDLQLQRLKGKTAKRTSVITR